MSGRRLLQRGEVELLRDVRKRFERYDSGVIRGIGDDAAVIAPLQEKILVTTDMMNEGVHFDLSFSSPFHLGFKLISVNVSDIYAMGGRPRYAFLDLGMKAEADEEFLWEFYDGLENAMELYGVRLLGGDLCSVRNDMVLSATLMGTAAKAVLRSGAAAGDKVYVTGTLGDSACGLEILRRLVPESREQVKRLKRAEEMKNLDSDEAFFIEFTALSGTSRMSRTVVDPLLRRHLMPEARDSALIAGSATSLIDISDGLFIDLVRLCDESGIGVRIQAGSLPLSLPMMTAAEELGLDPFSLAVSGGEDYELLFTLPADIQAEELGVTAACIGEITSGEERVYLDAKGKEQPLTGKGYQHFEYKG